MREFSDEKYIRLIEKSKDPILLHSFQEEERVIREIENPKEKTFIDLGAGHGRALPFLASIAGKVISIEINKNMLPELSRRTKMFENAEIIVEDMTKLSKLLKDKNIKNPVLLVLNNTLGTIEGNSKELLDEMRQVAKSYHGEIILTLLRSEKLESWGVKELYSSITDMVGEVDFEKTNYEKGLFVSKTGYTSKWRDEKEIREIKEFFGGECLESGNDYFTVLHIRYKES